MFKKVSYDIKVRVKGNDITGYYAQLCISYDHIFTFFNNWSTLSLYKDGKDKQTVFTTIEEAQTVAMNAYNQWISYAKQDEDYLAQVKNVSNKIVWEYP